MEGTKLEALRSVKVWQRTSSEAFTSSVMEAVSAGALNLMVPCRLAISRDRLRLLFRYWRRGDELLCPAPLQVLVVSSKGTVDSSRSASLGMLADADDALVFARLSYCTLALARRSPPIATARRTHRSSHSHRHQSLKTSRLKSETGLTRDRERRFGVSSTYNTRLLRQLRGLVDE